MVSLVRRLPYLVTSLLRIHTFLSGPRSAPPSTKPVTDVSRAKVTEQSIIRVRTHTRCCLHSRFLELFYLSAFSIHTHVMKQSPSLLNELTSSPELLERSGGVEEGATRLGRSLVRFPRRRSDITAFSGVSDNILSSFFM